MIIFYVNSFRTADIANNNELKLCQTKESKVNHLKRFLAVVLLKHKNKIFFSLIHQKMFLVFGSLFCLQFISGVHLRFFQFTVIL